MGNPIPCNDAVKWERWFESSMSNRLRQLRHTTFADGTCVSTVFLGIDHNFGRYDMPILWETMIFAESDFAKEFDGEQRRYSSKEEAIRGHELLC